MEGKENPGHIKNRQKTNMELHDQKHAHSVVFLEKLNAKTKSIAIFIWTTDLQTLVLVCPSLVPLPRKDSGGSRMGQEGDAESPPLLFFFLFSPFSSVTFSYPARRGVVSPKSVCVP